MFRNRSIRTKLLALVLSLVLITIVIAAYISYSVKLQSLESHYQKSLSALADMKVRDIRNFTDEIRADLILISGLDILKDHSFAQEDSVQANPMTDGESEAQNIALNRLLHSIKNSIKAKEIYVTDLSGEILNSTAEQLEIRNIRQVVEGYDETLVPGAQKGVFFGKAFKEGNNFYMVAGAPVVDGSGNQVALCYLKIDLAPVYKMLNEDLDLGETVETVLTSKNGKRAVILNPVKSQPELALEKGVFIGDRKGEAMQEAVSGNEGAGHAIDYRGTETLAVWRYVKDLNWGLVVKIDMSELRAGAFVVVKKFAVYGGLIFLFTLLITLLVSQLLMSPMLSLKEDLESLSHGVLPEEIEVKSGDELGRMAETANKLTQGLRRTAVFAEKIGSGDLQVQYTPLSDQDQLGNALLNMRDNLVETEKRDKERHWIMSGMAEISEILRSHNRLDDLGDAVIAFITEKIDAIQGAFYVVNDEAEDEAFIELNAAYAYHKKKYINARFKFAQGLVGQAAAEQDTILRTEIPYDYVSITSGLLGDKRPTCILITPLIAEEKVYGVLEFAGFTRFTDSQIKFTEEISLIIARTIFNIKVNERTRKLLEESQKMSNELQAQQEVLRQNAEEMAATQEELKRTNQRLEDQIQEVNRTRNRMQLLLENASEVIAIYEKEGTIRYISPSVERILGHNQDDMIGINDKVHVHPESVDQYEKMFREVLENPYDSVTMQYEYIKKNGEAVWLEATATNFLSDAAIQGIIVNSRDITERRRAEREERMRSKMQALSENSPDLITRLTGDGEFFYINPVIENYTGLKPEEILHKTLDEITLDATIKEEWRRLLEEVESKDDKVAREIDFPSVLGERVMQVNAIPEYNGEDKMESVLVVSHDITERKQIELEIQSKNRKITESINYAKRIQSAILPNNAVIRQMLPDSFILYKARDVVSGDFPWYLRVGDKVFLAAVDCTGHGVPGALISLIGYFLLNDIVRSRKIGDPGEILDALDRAVTKTLRQDLEGASTKDGMDIALCTIDLQTNEVGYAGAHRPLYWMNKGEMVEIKGDKFPIGGGIYKNQTRFKSHRLKMQKGDSVFFCSDGFPDQFGGPDNRKFGPRRLRELIVKHHNKSMSEVYKIMDEAWTSWKGDQKQTDDVLLIGIKF